MNGNYQYNSAPYYYNQPPAAALNGAPGAGLAAPGAGAGAAPLASALGDYYRYPTYNYYQQPTTQQYYQGTAAATLAAASTQPAAAPAPAAATAAATGGSGAISDTLNAALSLTVGQYQPPGIRPRVTTTMWEDEKTLCYQVDANNVSVVRRADNNMINGTKLLNVAQMTRGRRDGILKLEKVRHVVKIGLMHLKGVWIPFERALSMAQREGIVDLLYPLFVRDIKRVIQTGVTPSSAAPTVKASSETPPTQTASYYQGGAAPAQSAAAALAAAPQLEYPLYQQSQAGATSQTAASANGLAGSHQSPQPSALASDQMKMYPYGQQATQQQQQPYYQNAALYYQQSPYGATTAASTAPLYLAYPQGAQMYGYSYGQVPQPQQAQAAAAPMAHPTSGTPQQPALATPQAALATPQQPALATPQQPADAKKEEE